jgi:hypothetical protein
MGARIAGSDGVKSVQTGYRGDFQLRKDGENGSNSPAIAASNQQGFSYT